MPENIPFKIAEKLLGPHLEKLLNIAEERITVIKAVHKAYGLLLDKSEDFEKAILLTETSEGLINIPLLAKLTKRLMMTGKTSEIDSKTDLFNKFIDEIIRKQAENDVNAGLDKEEQEAKYHDMIAKLEELSLKLMREGKKERFTLEDAKGFFHELALMKKAQLISVVGHILDIESEEGYSEDEHRFRHPNFQEYFAAKQLMVLYNQPDTAELFSAMVDISRKEDKEGNEYYGYEREVGLFFSELVEKGVKENSAGAKKTLNFWQDTLLKTDNDWVRTYALQVRDKVGGKKARDVLNRIFKEEDQQERNELTDENIILIPAGKYLHGEDF